MWVFTSKQMDMEQYVQSASCRLFVELFGITVRCCIDFRLEHVLILCAFQFVQILFSDEAQKKIRAACSDERYVAIQFILVFFDQPGTQKFL